MSYILGYIVADGCICKRKGRKNSYVLNITSKDKESLLKMGKHISPDCSLSIKYNSQKIPYYQIYFCNRKICEDLMNLGIFPRKTYNLNPIKVPERYFSDFVRGFFDGDGSVYIYKVNKVLQIKANFPSTSLSFITDLNQHLSKSLDILLKTIHQVKEKKGNIPLYYIDFYIDDCEKLAEFMYQNNPTLYLPRKRQIFEKWKSTERRHYIKQNYPSKIGWQLNQAVFA